MGFEGIVHKLCSNGHYEAFDAITEYYDFVNYECNCGQKFIWEHVEDITNGTNDNDPMNNGEFKKYLRKERVLEECDVISKKTGKKIKEILICISEEEYNIPTTFGKKIGCN